MVHHSVLYPAADSGIGKETPDAPDFFNDLNLDQIIDAVTNGKQEYSLPPYYHTDLHETGIIRYRHEVFQDLEKAAVIKTIKTFEYRLRSMRDHLVQADKRYYDRQKKRWFLSAVEIYCEAVASLAADLGTSALRSRGLKSIGDYAARYAAADEFTTLQDEIKLIKNDLSKVHYCILINGSRVKVRAYEGDGDYSAEVDRVFDKFKKGEVKGFLDKFPALPDLPEINHVEAKILDLVALLYPAVFSRLDEFHSRHADFMDETIAVFDREIQFYVAYLEHIAPLREAGLQFCYPEISATDKSVRVREVFDLALAKKLVDESLPVVVNDFHLSGAERIVIVTGPNQGGKTTFARTFGQLHYLAGLGCPVPGREARLFLCDRLFTHFENEENVKNLRGKLEDDLVRVRELLAGATPNSVIVINELFNSTTLRDALFLARRIVERIIRLDVLCVYVTFLDELSIMGEKTVSMASTVLPENPTVRTFKIVRKPADGLAYALSLAEKHRVTHDRLLERIP